MTPRLGPDGPSEHSVELDGLRGVAVAGVLVSHFVPLPGVDALGWFGVDLFFVLSGFLITRILLTQRDAATGAESGRGGVLRAFYARRALRIFPIYYLTLLVLWFLDPGGCRRLLVWQATYTYNIYLARSGNWDYAGHFWSLCVEEQFYLFWPLLVLYAPRRWLGPGMLGVAMLAPIWRATCIWGFNTGRLPVVLPLFGSLDCLALGSFLAYVSGRPAARERFLAVCRTGGGVLMGLWALALMLRKPIMCNPQVSVDALIGNTAMAFFCCCLVARATNGAEWSWGRFLRTRWLTYLGRISYGVYVYHLFMADVARWLAPRIPVVSIAELYLKFGLSFVAAVISWHLIERPINSLKRLFPYVRRSAEEPAVLRKAA